MAVRRTNDKTVRNSRHARVLQTQGTRQTKLGSTGGRGRLAGRAGFNTAMMVAILLPRVLCATLPVVGLFSLIRLYTYCVLGYEEITDIVYITLSFR